MKEIIFFILAAIGFAACVNDTDPISRYLVIQKDILDGDPHLKSVIATCEPNQMKYCFGILFSKLGPDQLALFDSAAAYASRKYNLSPSYGDILLRLASRNQAKNKYINASELAEEVRLIISNKKKSERVKLENTTYEPGFTVDSTNITCDTIFTKADILPSYGEESKGFIDYHTRNIQPIITQYVNDGGSVIASIKYDLIISDEGEIISAKILNPLDDNLIQKLTSQLNSMQPWDPGYVSGNAVCFRLRVSISCINYE